MSEKLTSNDIVTLTGAGSTELLEVKHDSLIIDSKNNARSDTFYDEGEGAVRARMINESARLVGNLAHPIVLTVDGKKFHLAAGYGRMFGAISKAKDPSKLAFMCQVRKVSKEHLQVAQSLICLAENRVGDGDALSEAYHLDKVLSFFKEHVEGASSNAGALTLLAKAVRRPSDQLKEARALLGYVKQFSSLEAPIHQGLPVTGKGSVLPAIFKNWEDADNAKVAEVLGRAVELTSTKSFDSVRPSEINKVYKAEQAERTAVIEAKRSALVKERTELEGKLEEEGLSEKERAKIDNAISQIEATEESIEDTAAVEVETVELSERQLLGEKIIFNQRDYLFTLTQIIADNGESKEEREMAVTDCVTYLITKRSAFDMRLLDDDLSRPVCDKYNNQAVVEIVVEQLIKENADLSAKGRVLARTDLSGIVAHKVTNNTTSIYSSVSEFGKMVKGLIIDDVEAQSKSYKQAIADKAEEKANTAK